MRFLSDEEIDVIFGGDGNYAPLPSLGTVQVVGVQTRISGNFGAFDLSGWFADEYYKAGSTSFCYYASPNQALPDPAVPSTDRLRCLATIFAYPGMGPVASYNFSVINQYAYAAAPPNYNLVLSNSASMPSGYTQTIAGETHTSAPQWTYIYAAGVLSHASTPYYQPGTTTLGPDYGAVSGIENAIITAAHEWAHQHGVTDELAAEGYGVWALQGYRAHPPTNCPAR